MQTLGVAHKNFMTRCGLTRPTIKMGVVVLCKHKIKGAESEGGFPRKIHKESLKKLRKEVQ